MNHEEKMAKQVKMQKFLVSAYKSQDFAQSQENFARSHDRVTVTFRNSGDDKMYLRNLEIISFIF